MLLKDQEVLITIKNIGINGEGIGYYKKMAVFVDGVIPPEEVVVKITKVNEGHALGDVVRIKKKAFYRSNPFCKYYEDCGGCQLQHVQYEEQLRLKEDMIQQAFRRYTTLDLANIVFLPYDLENSPQEYRYKSQMPFQNTPNGVKIGLYRKQSRDLIEIDSCPIQSPRINEVNKLIIDLCDEYEMEAVDLKKRHGLLRYLVTRESSSTGEIQVTFVVTIFNRALKDLAEAVLKLPNVVSVGISKNHDLKNHEIFGETYELLAGKETIIEAINTVRYSLNPKAFYQLNPHVAIKMYDYIKTLFNPKTDQTLLDIYTGSGIMALYYAPLFKSTVGIDISTDSIASANRNKALNHINNAVFIQGDAYTQLKTLYDQKHHFDVCIFDPPRSGLDDKLIDLLLRKPIKKIIYVSCNPSTLAKNINKLRKKYDVKSVMPFDMFPQTSHVESITLLSLKTS